MVFVQRAFKQARFVWGCYGNRETQQKSSEPLLGMLTDGNKENTKMKWNMIIRKWVHLLTNINIRAVFFTSLRVHCRSSRIVNVSVSGLHQSTRRSMIGTANKSFRNLERASTLMDKSVTHPVSQQAVRVHLAQALCLCCEFNWTK